MKAVQAGCAMHDRGMSPDLKLLQTGLDFSRQRLQLIWNFIFDHVLPGNEEVRADGCTHGQRL